MNIQAITQSMDAEIATRPSENFGIKVGFELFGELKQAGLISVQKFGIMGTQLFEHDQHTYKGKFPVFIDFSMGDFEYAIGVPSN